MKLIISLFILSVSIYGQCEEGEFSTVGILDSFSVEIFNDDESADYSLMFIKSNGDVIDGLVVLSLSDDEAVFVNIIGNIHPDSFDPIMDQVYKKHGSSKASEE